MTCIICRGLWHEKQISKLYLSLDGHFYYVYRKNGLCRASHPSNSCPDEKHKMANVVDTSICKFMIRDFYHRKRNELLHCFSLKQKFKKEIAKAKGVSFTSLMNEVRSHMNLSLSLFSYGTQTGPILFIKIVISRNYLCSVDDIKQLNK